jgi:hypothetical protein
VSDRITVLGVPSKHERCSRNCVLAPLDVLRPGTRKGATRYGPHATAREVRLARWVLPDGLSKICDLGAFEVQP